MSQETKEKFSKSKIAIMEQKRVFPNNNVSNINSESDRTSQ